MDIKALRVKKGSKVELNTIDADETFGIRKADAEEQMAELGQQLFDLQDRLLASGKEALLVVLQGMDGSGKNGIVKHALSFGNPAAYQITSFKPPTEAEAARDFLWRVHQNVPSKGYIGVFNRSHYEDVLVPRVHQTLSQEQLDQRLKHIQHFEKLLTDTGTKVVKLFLHLSKDKQLERLQERLHDKSKMWKFDEADMTERNRWSAYQKAYEWVLEKGNESYAPWYVVPSNHRYIRNLVALKIVVQTLDAMSPSYPIKTVAHVE